MTTAGQSAAKAVTIILMIDPFYPFYESLLYLVSSELGAKGLDLDYLVKPLVACLVMLFTGILFFVLAVILDTKKVRAYRREDLR